MSNGYNASPVTVWYVFRNICSCQSWPTYNCIIAPKLNWLWFVYFTQHFGCLNWMYANLHCQRHNWVQVSLEEQWQTGLFCSQMEYTTGRSNLRLPDCHSQREEVRIRWYLQEAHCSRSRSILDRWSWTNSLIDVSSVRYLRYDQGWSIFYCCRHLFRICSR